MRILNDHDIDRVPFSIILEAVRAHVLADFRGETVAPPRHSVEFGDGGIVFTVGGNAEIAGFRAYETFAEPSLESGDQLVAVWNRSTRRLSGIAIGERLGALRTGALGGVAIDRMAPEQVRKLAVIGAGVQAQTQIIAACTVRSYAEIAVYSRAEERREAFAVRMKTLLKTDVHASGSAEQAVYDADVVILATSSCIPVIEFGWLKPGVHLNTVGPKTKAAHELPLEVAQFAARIATDSPQQIVALGDEHMLTGTDAADRIQHLGDPASHQSGNGTSSLFLSAGLAGTEVAALRGVLHWLEGNEAD
jgi:alanine dehydrogenase